ncbi:hypothetical protein [Aliiroseovarius sp. F47248L]|uniref:hypothetical protein n=1 Tax=Aliiroseovarius sp. F47248L TaxID=2926420 RepID=UPI001FF2909B|nr:hypothetical protein [Aliiroseovarius sp. F47248L]MCK0139306.1 hypothetical protein [Aliiroseovarius sp. F47248L]
MSHRKDFLHNFTIDKQVTPERALIDRLQLSIGDWGLFGSPDQVCETVTNLRNIEIETSEGECIPLFKGDPFLSHRQRLNISFASAAADTKNTGLSPLISGNLRYSARYRRPEELRDATSSFQFNTTLNLTRFIQAQKFRLRTRIDRRPRLLTDMVLAIDPDPTWHANETPLTAASNLIVGPWPKYAYAQSRSAQKHLSRYLRLVDGVLQRSFTMATSDGSPAPRRAAYYSLQEIEVYWEYDCDDPIQFVTALLPKIRSIGSVFYEGSVDTSYAREVSSVIEHQSPSIKARIAKGVWLRVYAKTNRRVRFEILLESNIIGKICGGQTASSRPLFCSKVSPLIEYATDKLNTILPTILPSLAPNSHHTAISLVTEICSACNATHTAQTIISSLVCMGRIALYNGSHLKEPVHKLRDLGVLQTVIPRSRNYVVTPRYEEALTSLRGLGNKSQ